jgi:hypothetical protein
MFLDIGVGILLSIIVSWIFQTEPTVFLILSGALFSLLPDLDFLIELVKHGSVGGKVIREHRELLHYPLSYLPVTLIIFLFFGKIIASLFFFCVFCHFLHDSIGIGWGIKWFWPFSEKSYKFFSNERGVLNRRIIMSWDKKELEKIVAEHGDPDWIKNIYFKPSPIFIFEFLALLLAIVFLYFYFY